MARVDTFLNRHAYGILIGMTDPKRTVEASFGVLVREWRIAAGLSQSVLAARMVDRGFTAWAQSTVSQTEAGDRPLRMNEFWMLCEIFEQRPVPVVRALEVGTGSDRDRRIGALRAALTEAQRTRQETEARLADVDAAYADLKGQLDSLLSQEEGEDVG